MRLRFAQRGRPKRGETACGDAIVVRSEGDVSLFAVIDGLGHGPNAADAAARAVAALQAAPIADPLQRMMDAVHRALRGSRGAATTLCVFRDGFLSGCGVGNVEMRTRPSPLPFVLTPGILGSNYGPLRVFRHPLGANERLAVFSDGVGRTLSLEQSMKTAIQPACDQLFEAHASDSDDASLLLAETIQ